MGQDLGRIRIITEQETLFLKHEKLNNILKLVMMRPNASERPHRVFIYDVYCRLDTHQANSLVSLRKKKNARHYFHRTVLFLYSTYLQLIVNVMIMTIYVN